MCLVGRGLNFDGHNLGSPGQKEIHLVVMFATLRGPDVIEQFVTRGREHLSYDILVEVAQICRQLIAKQTFINDILGELFISEGKCYEEAGVTNKHFVLHQAAKILAAFPVGSILPKSSSYKSRIKRLVSSKFFMRFFAISSKFETAFFSKTSKCWRGDYRQSLPLDPQGAVIFQDDFSKSTIAGTIRFSKSVFL